MFKSDSMTRSSTDSSPGPPLDHGLLSPEETHHEHDVTFREEEDTDASGDIIADGDTVRDLKRKGKAREQILLSPLFPSDMDPTARSALKDYAPDDIKEEAAAYLSPPLTTVTTTVSEKFFRLQVVENLSWVFRRRGLIGSNTFDFDVDLGLESGSGSGSDEGLSSPGGGGSVRSGPEERDVDTAAFEEAISEGEESVDERDSFISSSPSSSSSTVEASSSRRATIGDTTLQQDPGPISAVVRFPSIFMQDGDISSLASSDESSTPLALFPLPLPDRGSNAKAKAYDEVWRTLGEENLALLKSSGDDDKGGKIRRRTENYAEVRVKHTTKRTFRRRRRWKVQEKRLCEFSLSYLSFLSKKGCVWPLAYYWFSLNTARDFFLIITLCFGMACAGILVLRPALMAFFGYGTLGGRLEFD